MSKPTTFIDVSDMVGPIWFTVEHCEMHLRNGAVLIAEIQEMDGEMKAFWTVRRLFENQWTQIGGRVEKTIEDAKRAAWEGMETWRDTVEQVEKSRVGISK